MDEYIKRETLLRIAKKLQSDDAFGVVRLVREIETMPSEDVVEAKEGRWKGAGLGDYYCSLCCSTYSGGNEYKYCPNCGAKMSI